MSNHTNDPWETEMSRTFDQRVRDLHESPLSFDQVKGKATKIRRTRRIAVAGGVLAAAAVIVPVAVFAGGLNDNGSSPDIAPQPKESAKDPEGPGYGYLEGRLLHRVDGTTSDLSADYGWLTQIGDTVFAVRNNDDTGQATLDVLDDSGEPTQSVDLSSYPVVDDAHTVIAYVEVDGDLVTRGEDPGSATSTEVPANASPRAVTDTGVILEDGMAVEPPMIVDPATGDSEVAVPGAIGIQDAGDNGLLTVQSSYSDEGSCGGVYDQAAADFVWDTCDFFLYSLSPGGKYVDATHPYLDGFGNAYASILDAATGDEIIQFDPAGGAITQTVWQDEMHLLVRVYDYEEGWSVYRVGADKSVDVILGPRMPEGDYPEGEPAFTIFN